MSNKYIVIVPKEQKFKALFFRIPASLHKRLKDLSIENGTTIQDICRQLLEQSSRNVKVKGKHNA